MTWQIQRLRMLWKIVLFILVVLLIGIVCEKNGYFFDSFLMRLLAAGISIEIFIKEFIK